MSFQMKDLEIRHYKLRKQLAKQLDVNDWQLEHILVALAGRVIAEHGYRDVNLYRSIVLEHGPGELPLPALPE